MSLGNIIIRHALNCGYYCCITNLAASIRRIVTTSAWKIFDMSRVYLSMIQTFYFYVCSYIWKCLSAIEHYYAAFIISRYGNDWCGVLKVCYRASVRANTWYNQAHIIIVLFWNFRTISLYLDLFWLTNRVIPLYFERIISDRWWSNEESFEEITFIEFFIKLKSLLIAHRINLVIDIVLFAI